MAASIKGARVLYNTYWVRFDRGDTTHERAVKNTIALIQAAKMAGIERIVHVSITNPSLSSDLPYFRGKAVLEEAVRQSQISHAIVRPTVIFGNEDILINNIAFLLRKLPVFLMPGDGKYLLQPVFVEDVARIAVEAAGKPENIIVDAVGPEVFRFEQLVRLIAKAVGSGSWVVGSPPSMALFAARVLGAALKDVVLTKDEIDGLMAGLLISNAAPTGKTLFSRWIAEHAGTLGRRYASEVNRHFNPSKIDETFTNSGL